MEIVGGPQIGQNADNLTIPMKGRIIDEYTNTRKNSKVYKLSGKLG